LSHCHQKYHSKLLPEQICSFNVAVLFFYESALGAKGLEKDIGDDKRGREHSSKSTPQLNSPKLAYNNVKYLSSSLRQQSHTHYQATYIQKLRYPDNTQHDKMPN